MKNKVIFGLLALLLAVSCSPDVSTTKTITGKDLSGMQAQVLNAIEDGVTYEAQVTTDTILPVGDLFADPCTPRPTSAKVEPVFLHWDCLSLSHKYVGYVDIHASLANKNRHVALPCLLKERHSPGDVILFNKKMVYHDQEETTGSYILVEVSTR